MGTSLTDWYGASAAWRVLLERDARRMFGSRLRHVVGVDTLTYRMDDVKVPGDRQRYSIGITFYAIPPYNTYGQRPQDFPRVHVMPSARSKHRYPEDNAFCLWQPEDPPERRWASDLGLLVLIEMIRRHLFLELRWRQTGVWLLEDAPHGLGKHA